MGSSVPLRGDKGGDEGAEKEGEAGKAGEEREEEEDTTGKGGEAVGDASGEFSSKLLILW